MEGILHVYHPSRSLLLFEHVPRPRPSASASLLTTTTTTPPPPYTLLFIGGMFDNFLNPGYPGDLAALFSRRAHQTWSVMHVQLSSAGRSFGTSSLDKDVEEIAVAVNYIRSTLRPLAQDDADLHPVVLMGHSTGCQDVLHYLYSSNPLAPNKPVRPAVQGAILQAPASDRVGVLDAISKDAQVRSLYMQALHAASDTPTSEHRDTLLPLKWTAPLFGRVPMCVSRFLSLVSPGSPADPGPDDLFSHDLTDHRLQTTFGVVGERGLLQPLSPSQRPRPTQTIQNTNGIPTPSVLALHSDQDEYIPNHIDKAGLLTRWADAMRATGSKAILHPDSTVIEGGNHGLLTWRPSPSSSSEDRTDQKGQETEEQGTWARMVSFREIVLKYMDEVVGGVAEDAWDLWRKDRDELVASKERQMAADGSDDGAGDGDVSSKTGEVEKSMKDTKL